MTEIDPADLRNFELQIKIYGTQSPTPEFIKDVEQQGIIEPLVVHNNGNGSYTILAGHRRMQAARSLKLRTVPCIVREGMSELDQRRLFLGSNRQREKTNREKALELEAWEEIVKAEAEARKIASYAQPGEKAAQGGGNVSTSLNIAEKRKSRDELGEMVGVSGRTAENILSAHKTIRKLEDAGETEQARELAEVLETRGAAPAARLAQQIENPKTPGSDLRHPTGEPVAPCHEEEAKLSHQLGAIVQKLGKIISEVEQMFGDYAGVGECRREYIIQHINLAKEHISLYRPWGVCQKCHPEKPRSGCGYCKGRGWVDRMTYRKDDA